MNKILKKDDILTIFSISDFMANTTKSQVRATGEYTASGQPIFKENKKGARKMFTLRNLDKKDTLVFLGEVPFKTDGEVKTVSATGFTTSTMRGNACLNLAGNSKDIIYYIIHNNTNENFTAYDVVIHIDGANETPLFPNAPTSHAVVERIRNTVNA